MPQLEKETFEAHWQDETWHEVLRLIAADLDPKFVSPILEHLIAYRDASNLHANLFLAAECYAESRTSHSLSVLGTKLRESLTRLADFDLPQFGPNPDFETAGLVRKVRCRALEAVTIYWPHDPATVELLKQSARFGRHWVSGQRATELLGQLRGGDPGVLLWLKTLASSCRAEQPQMTAVEVVARYWQRDPGTLMWLMSIIQSNDPNSPAASALASLNRYWWDEPDVQAIIRDCARAEERPACCVCALEVLSERAKGKPELHALLVSLVTNATSPYVRSTALHLLARGWKSDPSTFLLLTKASASPSHSQCREAAIQELAASWGYREELPGLLRPIASNDPQPSIRILALTALGQCNAGIPETLSFLKSRLSTESEAHVATVAVRSFATLGRHHDSTRSCLMEFAVSGSGDGACGAAVAEVGRFWSKNPSVRPWLEEHIHDSSANPSLRAACLRTWALRFRGEVDTLPALKQLCIEDSCITVRASAVRLLAKGESGDPELEEIFRRCAECDDSAAVRMPAIRAVARGKWATRSTFAWLIEQCEQNTNAGGRLAALEELVWGWHNEATVFELAKRQASGSDDWAFRQFALQALARTWHDEPTVIEALETAIQRDQHPRVRETALCEFVWGWEPDARVVPHLLHAATHDEDEAVRRLAGQSVAVSYSRDPDVLRFVTERGGWGKLLGIEVGPH